MNYRIRLLAVICIVLLGSCIHASGNSEFVRFSGCPDSPNCVSSLAPPVDEEHYIEPLIFDSELTAVFEGIYSYLSAQPEAEIIVSEDDEYIHAVYRSKIFRFKDDVEFAFRKSGDGRIIVDIQSRSRVGYSDMGVNRNRMEEIRKSLPSHIK